MPTKTATSRYLILSAVISGEHREIALVFPCNIGYVECAQALAIEDHRIVSAGCFEVYESTVSGELMVSTYWDSLTPEPFGPDRVCRTTDGEIIRSCLN